MEPVRRLPALGRAGGKAILFGEHAVVYGGTAVAVPVTGLGIRIIVEPGEDWRLPEPATPGLDQARDALLAAAGWDGPALGIEVSSDLPLACGLGSSAALSVALARAVLTAQSREHDPALVRDLADAAEAVFHGNPSGVDVATVVQGHPIRFRRGEEPRSLAVEGRFDLWVVDTRVRSQTSEVVAAVARLRRTDPGRFEGALTRIAGSVTEGIAALGNGDLGHMARAMSEAMGGLRDIDVSHGDIETVIADGAARGALAGKLSGAGRGGVVLLLAPDRKWDPGATVAGCPVLTRITLS